MARLEIDIALKNAGAASSGIDNFGKKVESAQQTIKGLVAQGRQLDGAMMNLRKSFQSGAVSEANFNKESQKLSLQLSQNRRDLERQQGLLRSFKASADQAANSTRSLGNAKKQLQAYSNDFTNGIRSANTVSMEFTRIIQDAPYGIQGVANNIQQLTANWGQYTRAAREAAAAQGQTVTTGQLVGGALRNLISPVNLLSLGISALTAGWVAYEMWQQRANKAAREAEDPIQAMVKALNNVSTTLYEAARASGSEAAELRILYQAATDATQSTHDRTNAAKQLIKQYPEQFKKMGIEKTMLGEAKSAYDQLSTSILATARAQAAYGRIGEKAAAQIAIDETNKGLREQIALNDKRVKQLNAQTGGFTGGLGTGASSAGQFQVQSNIASKTQKIQEEITKNLELRAKLQEDILDLEGVALSNQGKIIVNDGKRNNGLKQTVNLLQAVRDLNQRSEFSADIAGTPEGLDTLLKKNEQKYKLYLDNLDKLEERARKGKNVEKRAETLTEIDTTRKQIVDNQAAEEKAIRVKYAQDTADAIAAINDKAGLTRERGLQRDLDANKSYYDEQVRQNVNNKDILAALERARLQEEQNIRNEYTRKDVERAAKQYDKIEKIINKPYSSTANSKKIQEELDKRLKVISEYYENIRKILSGAGLPTFYTKFLEMGAKARATAGAPERSDLTNRLRNQIGRAVLSGIDQVASSITSIGQKNYDIEMRYQELREGKTAEQIVQLNKLLRLEKQIATGIGNTVNSLFSAINGAVGSVMKTTLTEQLGSVFSGEIDFKKFADDNKKSLYALGGQLVGSLVAGMRSPANTGAQAIGGAVSGAATGFAVGGPVGAVAGGLLGALSGIFSAGTAKKQLRLQEMQLAEQRKQTALAQRAAALAYTSSIIGQQTNQGNVTSVGRNEFGELTFRVQGKDLVAVLNREQNSR